MDIKEAAAYLKVSNRTIERYISQGLLVPDYVSGKHGLKGVFTKEQLDEVKRRMNEPRPQPQGIGKHANHTKMQITDFLTLTLQQASELSQLSEEFLNHAIAMKKLESFAVAKDDYRITRTNLNKFISKL